MKSKGIKILAAVLAVIMCGSVAAYFITSSGKAEDIVPSLSKPEFYSYENSAYTQSEALSVKGAGGEIFMPSDINNVYYTADLKNNISFFEYSNGSFVPYGGEVKTVSANLSATYEKIPVTVKYIQKDGKIFGCGVFTSDMDSSVEVYPFAFVKLINKPQGYGSGYLLLADFDASEFYKTDKIYSEIYDFNIESGKASTYVSNNTRLIDSHGTFRQDWTMLTDEFINNLGDAKYFISSRNYAEQERGKCADIMVLSNSSKPEIKIKNIAGLWCVNDEHGIHYIKTGGKGFKNIVYTNKKEVVLGEFEGNYLEDYLRSGSYIINKKSLVMTDLLTGTEKTLKDINIEKADVFSLSPDGIKAVFTFCGEKNSNGALVQTVIYCTVDGSVQPAVFSEPLLFAESCGFVWLDNNSVMSARALDGSGNTVGSVAYTF